MINQARYVAQRNLVVSYRNQDILIDALAPFIIAFLLALRNQLQALSSIMPILYSLAIFITSRSVMIKLVTEKHSNSRQTKEIMGLQKQSYHIGYFISSNIRMTFALLMFSLTYYIFQLILQLNWNHYYRDSFWDVLWPYLIYGYTSINQSLFFSALFDEPRIAGEIHTFFSIGMTFLIFLTFIDQVTESTAFYIVSAIFSPQALMSFEFVASEQVGLNRIGCKVERVDPTNTDIPENIYPSELINQHFTVLTSGWYIIVLYFLYLGLFIIIENYQQFYLFAIQYVQKERNNNILQSSLLVQQNNYENKKKVLNQPTIIIKDLIKIYNNCKVVDNLCLELYESQIYFLLGHNGAGKTTTISMLTGLVKKSSGKIWMYDLDLDKNLEKLRKSMGFCTQQDILDEELTVAEHLTFISKIKGQEIQQEELDKILETTELNIEKNKKAKILSGGSKRKLSLAMALVGNSKILFLDEPTSGMDSYSRRIIWNILKKIKEQKRTIILTTHHLDEAELLADKIGIMAKGKLVAQGSSDQIRKQFGSGYILSIRSENLIDPDLVPSILGVCEQIIEQSNDHMMTYNISEKQSIKFNELFAVLTEKNYQIDLKLKTLEDAFIRIGEDEDGFLLQQNSQLIEQSMLKLQSIQEIPQSIFKEPQFDFYNQLTCMFQRRIKLICRTKTNILTIILPFLTFVLGLVMVEYLDMPNQIERKKELFSYIKLSILAGLGVLAFSFNSTLYIILPVIEKEKYLNQILIHSGLTISAYWIGTFLVDYIIYSLMIAIYFITAYSLQLPIFMEYVVYILVIFLTFGLSYITLIYTCSFYFEKSENALRLFMVLTTLLGLPVPISILGIIYIFELPYLLYFFEVIFMILSPFFNYFYAFLTINNYYISQPKSMPLLCTETYQYCLVMIGQSFLFYTIIYWKNKQYRTEKQRQMNNNTISCIDLKKQYPGDNKLALRGVSISVEKGEILGIIGPNKAGKSTLLNILTGILEPSEGIANLLNQNVLKASQSSYLQVGICPQFDCLWDSLTTNEHLNLFGKLKGLKNQELDDAILYFLNIMDLLRFRHTKAGELSGGNKRKLGVSNALIGGSNIIFLDEPSTGVDPISRKALFKTLKSVTNQRNCSVILTTHTIVEAENLSDRLGILVNGEFKCVDKIKNLRKQYSNTYSINIQPQIESTQLIAIIQEILQIKGIQLKQDEKKNIHLLIPLQNFNFSQIYQQLMTMKNNQLIINFSIIRSSLEDIFIEFASEQGIND